jgi:uncharacterized OB-fold protein
MSTAAKPVPEVTEELRPFFAAARENRLVVQRCEGCGRRRFPPREICSECLCRDARWVESAGRGTVVSFNVMHQVYHPAFAAEVPYAVVLVELEDGGRMIANVVDCPLDRLAIGMAVEAVFEKRSDEVALPQFRPRA